MKTNLKNDTQAVSPVIGVILMVAITVVLAAIVFVLVSKLAISPNSETAVSFSKDATTKTLTVISADKGLKWSDFSVSGCNASSLSGNVTAGNTLTACAGHVTVTYGPTNTLIYATDF